MSFRKHEMFYVHLKTQLETEVMNGLCVAKVLLDTLHIKDGEVSVEI